MAVAEKLENLLSLNEAAKAANMNPVTLRAMCQRGGLDGYARKIGDSWIVLPEAVYMLKAMKDLSIIGHIEDNPAAKNGIWAKLKSAKIRAKHLLDLPDIGEDSTLYAQLKAITEALEEATK